MPHNKAIIHTLPLLIRNASRQEDIEMALACLRSLRLSDDDHTIVYHQGEIDRETLDQLLSQSGITADVLGDGRNVGIAAARQACFEHVYRHYPDTHYLSEIHIDMLFPPNWYAPLIEHLEQSSEPMLCPGIVTSSGRLEPLGQQVRLPDDNAELISQLQSLSSLGGLIPGFVHPVVHRKAALQAAGGYDLEYFRGKQGYEDDSLLLGYAYYMGTRTGWRPQCLLSSWVYHATMAQRMSLPDKLEDFRQNELGLIQQYGGYGLKRLAYLHQSELFDRKYQQYVEYLRSVRP